MTKEQLNLQQFADRHGLQVMDNRAIEGPRGEIIGNPAGWSYFQRGTGYRRFNPVTQAQLAIEAIGLEYTVKKADGWYVEVGPFKTPELAQKAKATLKNDEQETTTKTS